MYQTVDEQLWNGRIDYLDGAKGHRWHQIIEKGDLSKGQASPIQKPQKGIGFLGFASDEGVSRNQGRVGAKEGPDALRKAMANLPVHPEISGLKMVDFGDVVCEFDDLQSAQSLLSEQVAHIIQGGYLPFLLGGGHEIAYGHFKGIQKAHPNKKIGILNIDAHFDLRQDEKSPTSGTPFLQIAQEAKSKQEAFNYMVLGIQKAANTTTLFETAEAHRVHYLEAHEVNLANYAKIKNSVHQFMEANDLIYLTICLDAFAAAFAPGVSAPSPLGIEPYVIHKLLEDLMSNEKVVAVDIAELSPKLDIQNQTAKLAAALAFKAIDVYAH